MGRFEVGEAVARELSELVRGGRGAWFEDHERVRRLAPFLVDKPDDGCFLDRWMAQQDTFDLDRRDVLATANDDVLDAVAHFGVPVRVDHRSIACMKPAALESFRRGF